MTVMSTTMTVATMDGCLALDFGSIPRVVCAASHQRLLPAALAAVVTSKTTVPKARQWLLLPTLVAVAMSKATVSKDILTAAHNAPMSLRLSCREKVNDLSLLERRSVDNTHMIADNGVP